MSNQSVVRRRDPGAPAPVEKRRRPHREAKIAALPGRLAVARPLLPLAAQIMPYLEAIDARRWYSNFGPLLNAFEGRLSDRFPEGTEVVTVANGTQALTLTLKAMELEPGLVAIPAWTFVATAHAVLQAGLTPWFVDVDPETGMLDPAHLAAQLRVAPDPVRAVIPVAPHGQMPDLKAWRAFRDGLGVPVIVDAAAGFDAASDAILPVMVSLHATKALGVGEGGFIATGDGDLALRLRRLTTYGFQGSRESMFPATNAKLSEYAAAVGMAAMDGWPATRLRFGLAAQRIRVALATQPEVRFQPGWGSDWVSSTCVVRLPDGSADRVETALNVAGVDTRRWWGLGCHRSPAFDGLPRADLTVTDQLAASTLGLPYSVDMSEDEIVRLATALIAAI